VARKAVPPTRIATTAIKMILDRFLMSILVTAWVQLKPVQTFNGDKGINTNGAFLSRVFISPKIMLIFNCGNISAV